MKSHTLYLLVVIAFTPSLGQSQGTFDCHCAAVDEECFPSPTPCSSGCQSGWDGPFCQRQNVAYNKSASQSGVYVDTSDCVPDTPDVQTFCGAHGAQLAVDGNDDTDYWHGSCAVTDTSNQSAWWRLDLGATYNISSLQIYQSNHAPLVPPYIEVFVDGQECYNVTGSDISSTIINVMCHQTLSGSTLTLRTSPVDTAPSLTLCEVKIFRCSDFWFGSKCQYKCHCNHTLEACDKTSGACASQCAAAWTGASCQDHNMALHQSAYQDGTWSDADNCSTSSTVYCGPRPATLAVDGSTDQNFRHGSCSQTALGRTITSWSLNLGSLHQIYRMKIYFPQKDIYPTTGLQVTVDGAVCYVTNTSLTDVANINCRQPLMGVFVSINLPPLPTSPGVTGSPTDRTLALCEVEIYECDDFWFGSNCSRLCRCQNTSEICDKMTGECPRSGCSAGWMGSGCQSACPRSTHGLNCSYSCGKCANNAVCDHVTGACPGSCAAGFVAKDCSECLTGLYGINCDQSCPSCPGNGSCDRQNGTCSSPCPAHHTGTNCDRCHDDWYGSKCEFHCGECRNDGPCNKTTGRCPNGCDSGWQGALCQQECADGRFGMDCSQVCGHCVDPAPCDKLTGICLDECAPGWGGDLCDKCLTGLYGINCDQSCPSCPGNGSCDRNNGTCSTPYPAHHAGTNCDRCHDDWYGSKCEFHCGECRNDGPCNKTTGRCPNGCDSGWQGALCQQECADGRFGMDCSQVCGHCVDPAPCDKLTGICLDECAPGWGGDLCDSCAAGFYSLHCNETCGHCVDDTCDALTGQCDAGCEPGWTGYDCVTRKRPTPTLTPTPTTASTTASSTSSSATSTTPTTPPHTTKARQHNQTPHGHRTTSHGNTQHGTDQPSTQGLSEGTLAGIIVSCVLVLCIVLHSFIFLRYSRRRSCHWLRARRKHTYGRDRVESPEDYTSGTELPKYATASPPGTEEDRVTAGIINPNYDQSPK
ncbi:multiple epidermal growth factor-like domains protein 6 [Haliotis rufescens]|uniref:multiple epidermal growth factor-like domains protein 6 n=1 Tax=Haliotis rufescens TaxID=6454 RepID=UPI00201EABB7|nr:multiple epidermal growth factor-like domains protein 6 [Haliotis rufescens]